MFCVARIALDQLGSWYIVLWLTFFFCAKSIARGIMLAYKVCKENLETCLIKQVSRLSWFDYVMKFF